MIGFGRWLINGGDALAYGAQRLGYGHGDVAVEALVSVAFTAEPEQMAKAPVFIPPCQQTVRAAQQASRTG